MKPIGVLPEKISLLNALNSIGENIIIADLDYTVSWMNNYAAGLMTELAPLFGLNSAEDMIGLNMSAFHHTPSRQKEVMDELTEIHRARILIRDKFAADIVVTPIKNEKATIDGYVVMLMDVTTQAIEEEEKEKLIKSLSVPIIKVWEKTIALPLIGHFDNDRAESMIASVLHECALNKIEYVLVDLSGIYELDMNIKFHMQKLCDCLSLIGSQCVIAGITPEFALAAGDLSGELPIFRNAHAGLKYVIEKIN
ncbi:RsbR, positive regulator of sigma-B [Rossellomorea vietnamensis]|uniref:RsbR, positive regulator of sigma-B n=1 Tax=Rossellomorea vietnamensis TaxID=218284 RepID=UPI003CFB615D